jgi:hypothetical protein
MLDEPLDVILSPNWERAYGYQGNLRFLAVWWSPNGDDLATAMMSAGVRSTIASGWHFFFDLIKLLVQNGHTDERLTLYEGNHCLLLDLEQRTAYYAPLRDALKWLRKRIAVEAVAEDVDVPDTPLPLAPSPLDIHYRGAWHKPFCIGCGGCGWHRTANWAVDGYKLCEVCRQLDAYVRRFRRLQERAWAHLLNS